MEDLAASRLLDDTLVLVTSEMGRKPQVGDRRSGGKTGAGRDHWTACMSVLMAGGGIQGGREVGATDARAEYPKHRPMDPADVVKTVYHAIGITDREATAPSAAPTISSKKASRWWSCLGEAGGAAPQVAENLEMPVSQATNPKPNRKWISLPAEGLLEASNWVKDFTGNIAGTVSQLGRLLWPERARRRRRTEERRSGQAAWHGCC